MDSLVSSKLLESIFEKTTPLHDGAVIISGLRIVAAGCVLPVSDNPDLPSRIGMRHKATVGVTEQSDAISIVVSEERGSISYARNGRLMQNVSIEELATLLNHFYEAYY
jgi:DNA integrity scanning protein DisA with diadenylate cyclase activity